MKKPFRVLAIVLSLASISACIKSPKIPSPPSSHIQPPQPNPGSLKVTQGGQPGYVQISGVLVEEKASKPELDESVSVVLRGGIGISGAEVPTNASHQV